MSSVSSSALPRQFSVNRLVMFSYAAGVTVFGLARKSTEAVQNSLPSPNVARTMQKFAAFASSSINHSFRSSPDFSMWKSRGFDPFDKNFVSHFAKSRRFRYDASARRMKA